MRLGVLFSGGKDSTFALFKALKEHEVVCLINLKSSNPDSYMFHTPAAELVEKQAEAIGLPLLQLKTKGEREKELLDLKNAIKLAKDSYKIQGLVTGAVASEYQASRIKKICDELKLEVFNPLWHMNQIELLKELVNSNFEVIITGIAAYPLDESWLGRRIDEKMIKELGELQEKFRLNPAGEGGEIETAVLNAPCFKKRIIITSSTKTCNKNAGVLNIKEAILEIKDFP